MAKEPHLLIILDGFGYTQEQEYNAVYQAQPKNYNTWIKEFPNTIVHASGKYVGLLDYMMGNSEVGHMTIGCGRIIEQPVKILAQEINNGSFFKNNLLIERFAEVARADKTLHLMGLLSDAGIHSYEPFLFALIKMAAESNIKKIIIHPFLDGRDSPVRSATYYLENLEKKLHEYNVGTIGTIQGRFYAMDRDSNWSRTEKSYNILTKPIEGRAPQPEFKNWRQALNYWYSKNLTDEFVPPTKIKENSEIKPGDAVLFFNLREDRARQLTAAFVQPNFNKFKTEKLDLTWFITAIKYSPEFKTEVICPKEIIVDTLFDVLERNHKLIFSIAESEKYACITYFFNGNREIIRSNETRVVIPSKSKDKGYAHIPQMSATEITKRLLATLKRNQNDFYLINYANADMVGHSGDIKATCKAIDILDDELKKLFDVVVEQLNGTIYITADHGNAEYMFNKSLNQPSTAHTNNPVPFVVINKKLKNQDISLKVNQLSQIAPFILTRMGLEIPDVMKPLSQIL